MARFNIPRSVVSIASILREAGHQCYLVGGAVRNLVMGKAPKDYDLATDARPEEVQALFRRVIPTGIDHGTVTVVFKGENYEMTTFRSEADYSDGRRPDAVRYEQEIDADLSRRDFTINGMAIDVLSGRLHDPFDGRADIRAGLVRAIGDPEERLREDGLRILRAFRFAAQLEFAIEEKTYAILPQVREALTAVAAERIRDEILRMLEASRPSGGLRPMHETAVLELVIPELAVCAGTPQELGEVNDLFEHLLLTCDATPANRPAVRLAGLLHDIGKPETMSYDDAGGIHFHSHDLRSAEMAEDILTRLRFPNKTVRYVSRLIAAHMRQYNSDWSDAAVRRFVHRVGVDAVWDLIALQRANGYGKHRRTPPHLPLDELADRVARVLEENTALSIKDLAVNGNDLRENAGIPPGPRMGHVLEFLLETVIDDPSKNERARLLAIAREMDDGELRISDQDSGRSADPRQEG